MNASPQPTLGPDADHLDQFDDHDSAVRFLKRRFSEHHALTKVLDDAVLSLNPYSYQHARSDQVLHRAVDGCLGSADVETCLVVAGESGSGKTVCCSKLFKHLLMRVSDPHNAAKLQADLLEIFGNAPTSANKNSSRFAKIVKVTFNNTMLTRCEISVALLETTRVTHGGECGGRGFHAFYAAVEDSNDKDYQAYVANVGETTAAEYKRRLKRGLRKINLDADAVVRVLKAIKKMASLKEDDEVCRLLNVDESLWDCFKRKTLHIKSEDVTTEIDSVDARMATLRTLYSRLLEIVASRCTSSLIVDAEGRHDRSVSLVDLFGFESEKSNGLQQLLINYANEKLHGVFCKTVALQIASEYEAEGILLPRCVSVFPDNNNVIRLFELGVLPALEEHALLRSVASSSSTSGASGGGGSSSSRERVAKTIARLAGDNNTFAVIPSRNSFSVRHYAGEVLYEENDMVRTNARSSANVSDIISALVEQSSVLREIFASSELLNAATGTATKAFSSHCRELTRALTRSETKFVRCIKSNDSESPWTFDSECVSRQLRHSGVVEAVRVARRAHPYRATSAEFAERYGLALKANKNLLDEINDIQMGSTKLFVGKAGFVVLERAREAEAARAIVAFMRTAICRQNFLRTKRATERLQRFFRRAVKKDALSGDLENLLSETEEIRAHKRLIATDDAMERFRVRYEQIVKCTTRRRARVLRSTAGDWRVAPLGSFNEVSFDVENNQASFELAQAAACGDSRLSDASFHCAIVPVALGDISNLQHATSKSLLRSAQANASRC